FDSVSFVSLLISFLFSFFFFLLLSLFYSFFFFFFNDTATTEIYTLSLHDALPILASSSGSHSQTSHAWRKTDWANSSAVACGSSDRKSTRLNSSHVAISYAVFCLKKKKKK